MRRLLRLWFFGILRFGGLILVRHALLLAIRALHQGGVGPALLHNPVGERLLSVCDRYSGSLYRHELVLARRPWNDELHLFDCRYIGPIIGRRYQEVETQDARIGVDALIADVQVDFVTVLSALTCPVDVQVRFRRMLTWPWQPVVPGLPMAAIAHAAPPFDVARMGTQW